MRAFQLVFMIFALLTALAALAACSGAGHADGTDGSPDTPALSDTENATVPDTSDAVTEAPSHKTSDGTEYTAEGFYSSEESAFLFKKELVLTFDPAAGSGFNRLSFSYSSSKPVKAEVRYKSEGADASEIFYFEAGTELRFRGLISSYLSGGAGGEVSSLTITALKGSTKFELLSLSAEHVDVLSERDYYLENDRYRVGIRLSWGGGVNFIEDKQCPVEGLSNLINCHDTGRLIQQSYYGTAGNSKYTPGNYNGSKWAYNPVQGGDQYGNPSRLIDVSVEGDSVYVKSQPQDWSLDNKLTPSYMENRYTLSGGMIRVDNRFVDFSGWEHRYAHQELPAFYVVSYLDRFVYYGGSNGWTGEDVTVKDGLQFWGDAQYAASCRFTMKKGNTETWCAWVSSKDDYGIGLYVPEIDQFYAGRFGYNGSKSPSNGATNYVAPLLTLKLASYSPVEYSYLITTGTVADIRAAFTENRDFADNSALRTVCQSMR